MEINEKHLHKKWSFFWGGEVIFFKACNLNFYITERAKYT